MAASTLQVIHASDFEAGLAAPDHAPRFAAIVGALEEAVPDSIILSSGDTFITSPFLNDGFDPTLSAAQHNAALVRLPTGDDATVLTVNEESAGITDAMQILNRRGEHVYLFDVQVKFNSPDREHIGGGQLPAMTVRDAPPQAATVAISEAVLID